MSNLFLRFGQTFTTAPYPWSKNSNDTKSNLFFAPFHSSQFNEYVQIDERVALFHETDGFIGEFLKIKINADESTIVPPTKIAFGQQIQLVQTINQGVKNGSVHEIMLLPPEMKPNFITDPPISSNYRSFKFMIAGYQVGTFIKPPSFSCDDELPLDLALSERIDYEFISTQEFSEVKQCTGFQFDGGMLGIVLSRSNGKELTVEPCLPGLHDRSCLVDEDGWFYWMIPKGELTENCHLVRFKISCGLSEFFENLRCFGVKTYYVKVMTGHGDKIDIKERIKSMSFEIKYMFLAMMEQKPMVFVSEPFLKDLEKKLGDEDIQGAYEFTISFCKQLQENPFSNPLALLNDYNNSGNVKTQQIQKLFVKYAIVSDNNQIDVQLPVLVGENRVFRQYKSSDFIKIYFKGSKIRDTVTILGKKFQIVGGSQSQIKRGSIYYFDTESPEMKKVNHANEIMNEFGTIKGTPNLFLKVSRQSLNFTPSVLTSIVSKSDILYGDEIYADDGSLLSDGIGMISKTLADEVTKSLNLDRVPTAFQVRIAGCKGMLTVYPDTMLKGKKIILRKSMEKFQSDKYYLEVVNYTKEKPSPAYWNNQTLILLYSMGFNIFRDTFRDVNVMSLLKSHYGDVLPGIEQIDYSNPIMMQLLRYMMFGRQDVTRSASKILVNEGMTCYGLLDETGTLDDDEVLVLLGGKETTFKDKNGMLADGSPVIVCRYPVLKERDIKAFTARAFKGCLGLQSGDCAIVFSSKAPTSLIPGDLDGDTYFVCWETMLEPVHDKLTIKQDIGKVETEAIVTYTRTVETNDLAETFTEISRVGKNIGNIVKKWQNAKMIADGIVQEKSKRAVQEFQLAMDFPKTGTSPVSGFSRSQTIPDSPILAKIEGRQQSMYELLTPPKLVSIVDENLTLSENVKSIYEQYCREMKHLQFILDKDEIGVINNKEIFKTIQKKYAEKLKDEQVPMGLGCFSLIKTPTISSNSNLNYEQIVGYSFEDFIKKHINMERIENYERIEKDLEYLKEKLVENDLHYQVFIHGSQSFQFLSFDENVKEGLDLYVDIDLEDAKYSKLIQVLQSFLGQATKLPFDVLRFENQKTLFKSLNHVDVIGKSKRHSFLKKHHLRKYINQKPQLYLILSYLISRFKSLDKSIRSQFKTFEFCWAIIDKCILKGYIQQESPVHTIERVFEDEKLNYLHNLYTELLQITSFNEEKLMTFEFIKEVRFLDIWKSAIEARCKKVNIEYVPFLELEPLREKLGSGVQGEVVKMKFRSKEVAVKRIPFNYPDSLEGFLDELELFAQVRGHENVVECYGASLDGEYGCLIMELCDCQFQQYYLEDKHAESFSDSQIKSLIIDIARGMEYVHKRNILHRDPTLKNVVLKRCDDMFKAKIIDFHLSTMANFPTTKPRGTLRRYPPEAIDNPSEFSFQGEVYMFGNMIYEIYHRQEVFSKWYTKKALVEIKKGERPRIHVRMDTKVKKVLELCWNQKVKERPSFSQIIEMLTSEVRWQRVQQNSGFQKKKSEMIDLKNSLFIR